MNTTPSQPPTMADLTDLSRLCSATEWRELVTSERFCTIVGQSLAETERWMTQRLGRTISLSRESIVNQGDEKL